MLDSKVKTLFEILKSDASEMSANFFSRLNRVEPILAKFDLYLKNNSKVLDLGSGPFILALLLELRGHKVTAVEINPEAIKIYKNAVSKNVLNNTEFFCEDINHFNTKKTYDALILNDVLFFNTLNFNRILKQFTDNVRIGGYIIFDVWNKDFAASQLVKKYSHYKRYSVEEVKESLAQNGFEICELFPLFVSGIKMNLLQKLIYFATGNANTICFIAKRKQEKKSFDTPKTCGEN